MIIELTKNSCENKMIEFIKRSQKSIYIQFFELVAHCKYEFCNRQKNDFEL
jgi:hypothetical protein